ncbi:MAG: hypothetical protein ACYTEQ_05725 [Planctomycetota bacterium]|jgi:hypothetical protein
MSQGIKGLIQRAIAAIEQSNASDAGLPELKTALRLFNEQPASEAAGEFDSCVAARAAGIINDKELVEKTKALIEQQAEQFAAAQEKLAEMNQHIGELHQHLHDADLAFNRNIELENENEELREQLAAAEQRQRHLVLLCKVRNNEILTKAEVEELADYEQAIRREKGGPGCKKKGSAATGPS